MLLDRWKASAQKVSGETDNYHSINDEDALLHSEIALLISQAKAGESEDIEELDKILKEVDDSHKDILAEISTIISNI